MRKKVKYKNWQGIGVGVFCACEIVFTSKEFKGQTREREGEGPQP